MLKLAGFFVHAMRYQKPALSFEQQADLLLSRGFVAHRDDLAKHLENVGYYRLCAYWHPFKLPDDRFLPNTTLEVVWERYTFDRKLRLLIMDAIERIEIAFRSLISADLTMRFGPFAHLDARAVPEAKPGQHAEFLDRLRDDAQKSREVFVGHFGVAYDEFPDLPLWAAVEIMTLGNLLTLFRMAGHRTHKEMARRFGITGLVLSSWFLTLNYARNLCAHHSRLINRTMAIKPVIPDLKNDPRWHGQPPIRNMYVFGLLTILAYLNAVVAPKSSWRSNVKALFDEHPSIPDKLIGCPNGWRDHPFWA